MKNHLSTIPELPDKIATKKVRPKLTAWVDEDNCTGCQACVPFCPVDCIEWVPFEELMNLRKLLENHHFRNLGLPPVT